MDVDRRNRFTARFSRAARARRAQIQARLRFSAVSNKVTLLDAGVRAYGSPLLRRHKRDVERDTELALSFMSPYPGTTCDILDDVDDLGGAAAIPVEAVSGATARSSRFAAPLRTKSHVLDAGPQATWAVNAQQFRDPTPSLSTSPTAEATRDNHQQSENEEKKGEDFYGSRTKSLILRTNKRLYDAPSGLYMDMTKRARGYAPLQESAGRASSDGRSRRRSTEDTSPTKSARREDPAGRRSDPTFLRRMAEATAAAVAAEAAQEDGERAAKFDRSGDVNTRPQVQGSRENAREVAPASAGYSNSTTTDTSVLGYGLSLGDLNLTMGGRPGTEQSMGDGGAAGRRGLHRVEEEVDDWEEHNATYVDLLLGDLPKWIKGPPTVYASGAKISSRVHAWRGEARVQGENLSRMLETHENEHAVAASMYRSLAVAEDASTISSANSFVAGKGSGDALSSSIVPAVLGKSSAELESPGVIILPKKRPLVMGAASLCANYGEGGLLSASAGGGSVGGRRGASEIGSSDVRSLRKSAWEVVSEANALVFHEAVAEPSQQRDTNRRFDFTHHQNKRRVGKAHKTGAFLC